MTDSNGLSSIGFITDGNRRYAKKYGLDLEQAYRKGFEKAEEVFDWCLQVPGLKTATVYALSRENVQRSEEELGILFSLYEEHFGRLVDNKKIHENQVQVRVIGESSQLAPLRPVIEKLHAATCTYDRFRVYIALGYGGRSEILNAVKRAHSEGRVLELNEKNFAAYLYQPHDVDLIVRTGGVHRLSNFLPWQATYAELFFTEKLWPEFSKQDFREALDFYATTKRNFGR